MNYLIKDAGVLIIEDQKIIALDIADTVKKLGHTVLGIESKGEKAIAAVQSLKPDIILMDISLAGSMDGIEAAEKIGKQFGTPVIYISGNHDPNTIERSKLPNTYGYLVKPVDDCGIGTVINSALYRRDSENASWEAVPGS